MLTSDLINWLLDLLSCFALFGFMFLLKLVLTLANTTFFSKEDLVKHFTSLMDEGQASLLTVTYSLTIIRNIWNMNRIPYFFVPLLVVLVLIIIYHIIFYVLIAEIGPMKNGKVIYFISFGSLLFSIVSSLIYTIMQASV